MDAALGRDVDRLEGKVHQHRFPAPDAAPHIDAAMAVGLCAEQAGEKAGLLLAVEIGSEAIQDRHRLRLIRVRLQFVRGKESFIAAGNGRRSEEHTSELQSLMRNSDAVFCL